MCGRFYRNRMSASRQARLNSGFTALHLPERFRSVASGISQLSIFSCASSSPTRLSAENSCTSIRRDIPPPCIRRTLSWSRASALMHFLSRQFVAFGEKRMNRLARRREPVEHDLVEFGQRPARIHHQDHADQLRAALQIRGEQLLPVQLGVHRTLRRSHSPANRPDARLGSSAGPTRKVVDVLRASRRLARESQPLLIAQHVDGRRFSRVRASRERDFRLRRGRQVAQMIDGRKEPGLMEQE